MMLVLKSAIVSICLLSLGKLISSSNVAKSSNVIPIFLCMETLETPCTMISSQSAGVCKRINDCPSVKNAVIKFQQLPQTCEVHETQLIVCCPNNEENKKSSTEKIPGKITKMKCREYSAYANANVSEISTTNSNETKLVKQFAHLVTVGFEQVTNPQIIKWPCAGSIISEYYVLTSARCWEDKDLKKIPKYVKVEAVFGNNSKIQTNIRVAEYIRHPSYSSSSKRNDIALVKVQDAFSLNKYIRPICISTDSKLSSEDTLITAWSSGNFYDSGIFSNADSAILNLVDYNLCSTAYTKKYNRTVDKEIQICVAEEEQTTGCGEDFGTPLQTYHGGGEIDGVYNLVGLASNEEDCENEPGLYTKVSPYVEWIEDIVWPSVS